METLTHVLALVGAAAGVVKGAITLGPTLTGIIRDWNTRRTPTADGGEIVELTRVGRVTEFIYQLGLATEADVEQAMAKWPSPKGFTDTQRQELAALLRNLVRGARFHSTHGTRLDNYLTAEKLLDQLLAGAVPKCQAGQLVGEWELQTFLGMGGFGEVWKAGLRRYPVPRVFKFFTQTGARDWLDREAEVMFAVRGQLDQCPNVIDYLDVAVNGRPHPYLALEYAQLGSLEDWILKGYEKRAKIGVTELMRGIVRGVSDAHRHGIHHRDLKPANILLTGKTGDVTPKVADFGLGSVEDKSERRSSYRSQAVLVGTQMYQPPEAANPFKPRDPAQDDVFALGVIWYQVLVGELTRPAYDFADELAAAGADSRSIKLITKCLAAPKNRYPSACELYDAMDKEDPPPGPGEWAVPADCFDVAGIAREYLVRTAG